MLGSAIKLSAGIIIAIAVENTRTAKNCTESSPVRGNMSMYVLMQWQPLLHLCLANCKYTFAVTH